MQKDISPAVVLISLIAGLLNFFFIGFGIALTSGGPEMPPREIFVYVCVWTSLIHALISSWLFIYYKSAGRIIAILTSLIGLAGPIAIMTSGISFLWLSIALLFALTLCTHLLDLTKVLRE